MRQHSSRDGGILVIIILGMVLLVGIQQTYISVRNANPTTVSYEEFVSGNVDAEWLHITGIKYDLMNSAVEYYEKDGRTNKVYVPILRQNAVEGEQVQILVEIDDKSFIAFYDNVPEEDEQAVADYFEKNRSHWDKNEISGILKFGLSASGSDRDELNGIVENLAPEFSFIALDDKPAGIGFGLAMAGISALLLFFVLKPGKVATRRGNRKTGRTTRRSRKQGNE